MGEITTFPEQEESKIIEFDQVLNNLYSKSKELAFLIEAERHEKHDLSFQVAALSHDVKTPLTVLKGNIEYINHVHISAPWLKIIEKREIHKILKNILLEGNYEGFVSIEMAKVDKIEKIEDVIKYVKEIFG